MALPSTRISVPLLSGSSPSSWARGIGQGEAWRREKSTPGKGKAWQEGGCGAWLWTGWIWGASWSTTGRWVKQVWTLREEVGTERFSPLPGRIFSLIHYFFPCPTSPVHTKSTSPNIRILTNLLTHATSHPSDNTRLLTQAQVWIVTPPSLETWNSIFPHHPTVCRCAPRPPEQPTIPDFPGTLFLLQYTSPLTPSPPVESSYCKQHPQSPLFPDPATTLAKAYSCVQILESMLPSSLASNFSAISRYCKSMALVSSIRSHKIENYHLPCSSHR